MIVGRKKETLNNAWSSIGEHNGFQYETKRSVSYIKNNYLNGPGGTPETRSFINRAHSTGEDGKSSLTYSL